MPPAGQAETRPYTRRGDKAYNLMGHWMPVTALGSLIVTIIVATMYYTRDSEQIRRTAEEVEQIRPRVDANAGDIIRLQSISEQATKDRGRIEGKIEDMRLEQREFHREQRAVNQKLLEELRGP